MRIPETDMRWKKATRLGRWARWRDGDEHGTMAATGQGRQRQSVGEFALSSSLETGESGHREFDVLRIGVNLGISECAVNVIVFWVYSTVTNWGILSSQKKKKNWGILSRYLKNISILFRSLISLEHFILCF